MDARRTDDDPPWSERPLPDGRRAAAVPGRHAAAASGRLAAADSGRHASDDDLDRAFGPDTAAVRAVTGAQRLRRGSLVLLGFVVAGVVIAVVLSTIVGSVQNGVGGVFPQPQAALDRFRADASAVPGVQAVQDPTTDKQAFAAYDVAAVVVVDTALSPGQQVDVVTRLSAAAADAGGNGVRVTAIARIGALDVGVSADATVSRQRFEVARSVADIGGVMAVRCSSGPERTADDAALQRVVVVTGGTGAALDAVVATASERTHAVFPGATVTAADR